MTDYRHEQTEQALRDLSPESSDTDIATKIADYLLCARVPPILLALNHNGKASPCPLQIDKPGPKQCSVAILNPQRARAWVLDALARGYEVSSGKAVNERGPRSIAGERRAIQNRQAMASARARATAEGRDYDDEIPF